VVCSLTCLGYNSSFAGLLNSQCWCGRGMYYSVRQPDSACNNPCPGQPASMCGAYVGANKYFTMYMTRPSPLNALPGYSFPEVPSRTSPQSSYKGCYPDPGGDQPVFAFSSSSMTIGACIDYCFAHVYAFAALENGDQCYCGTHWGSRPPVAQTACNSPCTGNPLVNCGGPSASTLKSVWCTNYCFWPMWTSRTAADDAREFAIAVEFQDPELSPASIYFSAFYPPGTLSFINLVYHIADAYDSALNLYAGSQWFGSYTPPAVSSGSQMAGLCQACQCGGSCKKRTPPTYYTYCVSGTAASIGYFSYPGGPSKSARAHVIA